MTGINENDETEVIAVRSTAMAWQMVFTLIFVSCFIIVLVVVNNRISSLGTELHTFDLIFWLFVVFFAGILCYDIYQLVQIIRTPREVVVATGNKFFFCGKCFLLDDIYAVEYRCGVGRRIFYSFGRLIIRLKDGTVLKCRFVADVEKAHNRLYALISNSRSGRKNGENT